MMTRKLSFHEKQKVRNWLREHTRSGSHMWESCPCCGEHSPDIEDYLVSMAAFDPAYGTDPRGPLFPFVVVVCPDCGFSQFFNATVVGIVTSDPEGY